MCVAAIATSKQASKGPGDLAVGSICFQSFSSTLRRLPEPIGARTWHLGDSIHSCTIHSLSIYETYTEVLS